MQCPTEQNFLTDWLMLLGSNGQRRGSLAALYSFCGAPEGTVGERTPCLQQKRKFLTGQWQRRMREAAPAWEAPRSFPIPVNPTKPALRWGTA